MSVPTLARPAKKLPRAFYLMVLPAFALFLVFHTVPVLTGIYYSFTNYAGYGEWSFIGLSNYINLFRDERILNAYGFTFLFAIVSTIAVNIIALSVAMALNSRIKFKTGFRGIFFIPNILSILIVGYVFNYLFSNSVPAIAEALGINALTSSILAGEDTAWIGVVILSVWQAAAFNIIIYLAGLQTIPGELYEAASLDGASAWKQFSTITFPLIGAFFTINMVLSLKNFLQVFDQIISLTGGGPGTSTESISVLIYRGGFQGGEYGYQTANAVIYLFVIIAISFIQLRILQRREASF
ncbi:carbohydrate ABC transporter membrane protein 1, CUT1 family [Arthrobacter subterraneus]|uniref:Carbohydrate ABC transporter membrane protein 1, CUT1 family n=1 Tax=Arthrobacter subterraneus TaxID=335973 RepID=A0A1G8FY28_9MICC|nr:MULTISPECIES: sugar ABC transporter permease [Arthrobacter]SDH87041.1 carbohydrate ABC transporter membrane protein 1, CUT1 family [Arthrobacter subterraneus]